MAVVLPSDEEWDWIKPHMWREAPTGLNYGSAPNHIFIISHVVHDPRHIAWNVKFGFTQTQLATRFTWQDAWWYDGNIGVPGTGRWYAIGHNYGLGELP